MYGQAAANITDDIDLVVYTAAVHTDNPEYAEVVRRGIPMMPPCGAVRPDHEKLR